MLDFKTDAPPADSVDVTYAAYVAQVRAYGRLLEGGLTPGRPSRCGLLFTADGSIHWVSP